MNLLVQRSKDPGLPSVETFNTFFYPKLRSNGYSSVRRWTKKIDIFSVDILLVPVHLGVHWCLSVSPCAPYAAFTLADAKTQSYSRQHIFSLVAVVAFAAPTKIGCIFVFSCRWVPLKMTVSGILYLCISDRVNAVLVVGQYVVAHAVIHAARVFT